jgi:hypothetical protein
MDIKGDKAQLDLYEQYWTGYSSPIDLATFALHDEREAADNEIATLEEKVQEKDLDTAEWSKYHKALHSAQMRSIVCRAIAKDMALTTVSQRLVDETEPPSEIKE